MTNPLLTPEAIKLRLDLEAKYGFVRPSNKGRELEDQGWAMWLTTLAPSSFTSPFSDEHIEFWDMYWSVLMKKRDGVQLSNKERNIVLPLARGNAKCLDADTQITLADGTVRAIKDIKVGDAIVSYNELFGSMEVDTIKHKWKAERKQCIRLTTFTRKELTLSPEHQVLTINGWKQAKDIVAGDRIASPRIEPVFFTDNSHSDEEVRLLAYFLAEGNTTGGYGKQVQSNFAANITTSDDPIADDAIACAKALGFDATRSTSAKFRVTFRGGIRDWIKLHGMAYKKATEKRIPLWVFQLPERQKWEFLSAFIDTDGWISQKIGITLASKGMVEDLQRLFLQVGVISAIHYRHNEFAGAWAVTVDSAAIKERSHLLKLRVKHGKLRQWCNKRRYSLADTYPYQEMRGLPHGKGYFIQQAGVRISNTYDVTRAKIADAIGVYPHYRWQRLEANEVFWDKVVAVTDAGERETYDVEVAKNHNLITNHLVSHNSTNAELAAIAEGCILGTGFVLYLSDSQLLAEEHLYSVKAILENGIFAEYYPHMSKPKVSQTGAQAKFTQDTIITDCGWGMTARGITGNVRGGRLGTLRFTLIITDDIDSLTDSLAVIEKKKRILVRSVYPAMDKARGVTLFAQNLITENSVASQIVLKKTDMMAERTVIGEAKYPKGVPAFKDLELESVSREDGSVVWQIGKAVPTWEYFNIEDARNFLALSGKEAFLAEYQHEFSSRAGKVIPNYDESVQVISWSEFEKVFGERRIPQHWRCVCGVDIGYSDGMAPHYSAWNFIAVAAENSPMPGAHFVYRSRSFKGTAIEDQALAIWNDLIETGEYGVDTSKYPNIAHLPSGDGRQVHHWQMSHEKTGEMLTLRQRYGLPFAKVAHYKAMDGVVQWNHLSLADRTKPNPFKVDEFENGEWFHGRPNLFYIVDDDQLVIPRDDRGMKLLRQQVSQWEYVPTKITETGLTEEKPSKVNDDHNDVIKSLLYWLYATKATPLTESEKLKERMPEVIKEAETAQTKAQRALWLQREALRARAEEKQVESHSNIMDWVDRNI